MRFLRCSMLQLLAQNQCYNLDNWYQLDTLPPFKLLSDFNPTLWGAWMLVASQLEPIPETTHEPHLWPVFYRAVPVMKNRKSVFMRFVASTGPYSSSTLRVQPPSSSPLIIAINQMLTDLSVATMWDDRHLYGIKVPGSSFNLTRVSYFLSTHKIIPILSTLLHLRGLSHK